MFVVSEVLVLVLMCMFTTRYNGPMMMLEMELAAMPLSRRKYLPWDCVLSKVKVVNSTIQTCTLTLATPFSRLLTVLIRQRKNHGDKCH